MVASIIKTVENQKIITLEDPSCTSHPNISNPFQLLISLDNHASVSIWLMTEQNLVIIVGCVPIWRSLFTRTPSGSRKLAFSSLLSKHFPPGPEPQRNSASDLEALRYPNENEHVVDGEDNAERSEVGILPMPLNKMEVVRKDSIELPSLDLIGKPTNRTGSQ